ncbi:DUF305 domain-containing protein [Brachyspira hyodysenteriae]|uniref:DUF305 domain-containing protein n=1 Tax=Brachyspira hyodysenteriae TaxID=159 RepID=UPI00063DD8C7|nr:DUF305 domain-containing protein [Brachyspira hyodysenteriae]AUJ50243.1 hypothetical protein BH718_01809 [Brachyspira hyodysenteriae]KLI17148.1 hypothetical protein SU44_04380 [Brachyspira hyodysenteriae]MBT8719544.1 DUF305 domain-containing protein [Brachyspira hyodysenteriae]MBT8729783.1 DUF305 domain-containing protein [Brachyspira hyodysenteriae]MBT8731952.1 DUF305 domain-containing protein [Brachyspira hyodysenteriae]
MNKIKTIITIFIISVAALLIISCSEKNASASAEEANNMDHSAHTAHKASSEIVDLMHQPMMEQPFQKTANIDADFLFNMIPHHKGAILSSQKLLETTKNEKLIELANNIIAEQDKEVLEFDELIKELNTKNTDYSDVDTEAIGNDMQLIMDNMMADMSSIEITGDNDIDFIRGMIPHHQAAIDVSKKILEYTKDEKIKEIANRIITAQEKEIEDMNNMINSMI